MNHFFASFALSISADSVAWYGAVIATISFLVSVYNVLRDRARIKVWYSWDNSILGDPKKDGIKYLRVDVINMGRRPMKVNVVGAKTFNSKKTIVFTDSFNKPDEERILTEHHPNTSYLTDQNHLDRGNIWYIYAIDARGVERRVYSSIKGRLIFWLKFPNKTYMRILKIGKIK